MYNISIPIIRTMSQSDYIKRKQVAHTLRNDGFNVPNRLPAVFSSNTLLKYKQYQIVNDDSNTTVTRLVQSITSNTRGDIRDGSCVY